MELPFLTFAVLVIIAFFAGLISSIAGAGGLLTLPALLWAGLPPLQALATNKVQSAVGTLSSAWNFFRKGHIQLKSLRSAIICAFLGSLAGTWTVQQLGNDLLAQLIPVLLMVIALYFLITPKVGEKSQPQRISETGFAVSAALGMGFYGGFFGPGMGSIFPFLFVLLLGRNLVRATAETKVMVLTVNGTSALLFSFSGNVQWTLALCMAAAQMVGARIGSNLVMRRGAGLVQPLIVIVALVLALKLVLFP